MNILCILDFYGFIGSSTAQGANPSAATVALAVGLGMTLCYYKLGFK
jgi:hypothetical protein